MRNRSKTRQAARVIAFVLALASLTTYSGACGFREVVANALSEFINPGTHTDQTTPTSGIVDLISQIFSDAGPTASDKSVA